ncbi:MAG: PepSY domain-containing protein [Firmicutes bacterium]|nr:PepSY domain-containing protein [Bacillota bacterium]
MKRKLVTFVLTGLLAFSTTGMVFAETVPLENPITPDQPIVSEDPQSVITIDAAIAIALETVPDGSIVSVKLDKQHTVKVYKIQVKSGALMTMVKINAMTGDVLKTELENDPVTDPTIDPITDPVTDPITDPITDPVTDPTTDPITDPVTDPTAEPTTEDPAATLPAISFENAVQIALASVTDGTFVSIRLGTEHDVMVYKVIIQTGQKANPIKIDATSGDILNPTNDKNDKKPVIEKPAKKTVDDSTSQTNIPKVKGKK